jgi:GNAT superfamily N-acetyltransferase
MIQYRPAIPQDMSYMRDMDLKCHEQAPCSDEWWTLAMKNPNVGTTIVTSRHVPIGMSLWEKRLTKLPDITAKANCFLIHKLCVRPGFRNLGFAHKLLAHCHEEARRSRVKFLTMEIPSYLCCPNEDGDISLWLNKLGFRATMVLDRQVKLYGEEHDLYLFVFEVKP